MLTQGASMVTSGNNMMNSGNNMFNAGSNLMNGRAENNNNNNNGLLVESNESPPEEQAFLREMPPGTAPAAPVLYPGGSWRGYYAQYNYQHDLCEYSLVFYATDRPDVVTVQGGGEWH
jgi:hypothetical protein